jgi:hypothetical protein
VSLIGFIDLMRIQLMDHVYRRYQSKQHQGDMSTTTTTTTTTITPVTRCMLCQWWVVVMPYNRTKSPSASVAICSTTLSTVLPS